MLTEKTYGAVFTRRWVVDMMLDLCGYDATLDLGQMVAVEPACGDGAFLLPMVQRLSASLKTYGRRLQDAEGAIQARDLQGTHVLEAQRLVTINLVTEGWSQVSAERIAKAWVQEDDYLLAPHPAIADFVIGNPPYIRSEDLLAEERTRYLVACKTMTPGADIFVGFIEKGLVALKPGGVLCFIVADRWQHNSYGRKLRRMIVENYSVEAMFELHGVDAFAEEVDAYPAITQIRKGPQGMVKYATAKPSFGGESALRLMRWAAGHGEDQDSDSDFRAAQLPQWFPTDEVWPSGSPARLALIEELNERCEPLENAATGTRIGIGIATGADKVFVTVDSDAVEPDRLLPLVMTSHIRSGQVDWSPATWLINPWDDTGRPVEFETFPKLRSYLEERRQDLQGRHIAKESKTWFRTIDKVLPGLVSKPKLLLQDMKASIQPILDTQGLYPHHNLYWVTSEEWDLRVLGGLLLSRVAQMFIEAYGVKMRGGTLRFQAQYLRRIRVPALHRVGAACSALLADAFEARDADAATAAALEAYGIEAVPE